METAYFEETDWIHLMFKFIEHREMYEVFRGSAPACDETVETCPREIELNQVANVTLDAFPDDTYHGDVNADVDFYGHHAWDNTTEVREFHVIVNGKDEDDIKKGDRIEIYGHKCWGVSCDSLDEFLVGEETTAVWSNNDIWDYDSIDTWDPAVPSKPLEGQRVTIPQLWNITLDEDTPVLESLEISGILTFDPTKDITLRAKRLHIRGGQLISGTPENPTTFQHKIELVGERTDETLVFDGTLSAGNKVLAVTGELSMHGVPKKTWTKLATNAYSGDNVIFTEDVSIDGEVGWAIGDELVIASSTFERDDWEKVTITGVAVVGTNDSDFVSAQAREEYGASYGSSSQVSAASDFVTYTGAYVTKVSLSAPIAKYHIGTEMAQQQNKAIDTRAAVGNLNKNVVIEGYDKTNTNWNGNILVAAFKDFSVADPTNPETREGFCNLSHVAIRNCGQLESTKAALRYEKGVGTGTPTVSSDIQDVVITDSDTYGIYVNGYTDINFSNNFVFNSAPHNYYVTASQNISLIGNLGIKAEPREGQDRLTEKASNFFICAETGHTCSNVRIQNNYAGGAEFVNFMVPANECSGSKVNFSSGNYGQAAMASWRWTAPGSSCINHDTQYTASKNYMGGLISKAGATSITFKNLVLVDQVKGVSLISSGDDSTVTI